MDVLQDIIKLGVILILCVSFAALLVHHAQAQVIRPALLALQTTQIIQVEEQQHAVHHVLLAILHLQLVDLVIALLVVLLQTALHAMLLQLIAHLVLKHYLLLILQAQEHVLPGLHYLIVFIIMELQVLLNAQLVVF